MGSITSKRVHIHKTPEGVERCKVCGEYFMVRCFCRTYYDKREQALEKDRFDGLTLRQRKGVEKMFRNS